MTVLPDPSPWFMEHFGEHSQRVMLSLANAGRGAHERSLDAKAGSQLTTNEAYGSLWVTLPEEVVTHLAFLPGREVIRPSGSRYDLVTYQGTLIFPAKCGRGSSGADRIMLGQSEFRSRVFCLEETPALSKQEQLDFDSDFGLDGDVGRAIKDGSFGSATRVCLVAYDVTARGGLQHVYVGNATLDSSGLVTWKYREELPLLLLDGEGAAVAALDVLSASWFDDAPLPEADLMLRGPGELPGFEADDGTMVVTGTDCEADDRQ